MTHTENAKRILPAITQKLNSVKFDTLSTEQKGIYTKLDRARIMLTALLTDGASSKWAIEELNERRIVFYYIKDFCLEKRSINLDCSFGFNIKINSVNLLEM